MPSRERCPKCGSTNITGRAFDMADGDEAQERYCYDCKHFEDRLRSQGGVSWYREDTPHRMHSATGIEATLLAQIRAAPDDDAPRSIYADWLIERGDPLGTFIALQLARAQKRDPVVSEEEQALLDAHWSAWIGPASGVFEAQDVAFQRGFWSIAGATRRAQYDFVAQHAPPLPIEEVALAFDISRDPPELAVAGLAHVRRLSLHCLPELALRWIERAHAAKLAELTLVSSMNDADIREAIDRARTTCITRLTVAREKIAFRAERETDGSLLIRALVLEQPVITEAKHWIGLLEDDVDPGVKLEVRDVEPFHAQTADRLGLKLVKRAPRISASPKGRE